MEKKKRHGCLTTVAVIFGIIVVLGIGASLFSGSETSESATSDASSNPEKGNVTVSTPTVVSWTDALGELQYGYFFEFTNDGGAPVNVSSFDVTSYDAEGSALGTPLCFYAPKILDPGESGYGMYPGIQGFDEYPDSGVSVEVKANFSQAGSNDTNPLTCSDASVIDYDFTAGNADGKAVNVTVSNSSKNKYSNSVATAGLKDADGRLIGVVYGTVDVIPAGGSGKATLDWAVMADGQSMDNAATIDAHASPGLESD